MPNCLVRPHFAAGLARTLLVGLTLSALYPAQAVVQAQAPDLNHSTHGAPRPPKKSALLVDDALVTFAYALAFPATDFRSYIDKMSPVGFEYNMQIPILRNWYFGALAGYNRFSQQDGRRTYARENGDVTGTVYRALINVSLALMSRYYLLPADSPVRLFGGVRAGVTFGGVTTLVADLRWRDAPVGLLLVPEAGATLRLTRSLDVVAGYQYTFTTMSFRSVERATYHAIQVGLQIRY